ncbi:GlxA family transcriptional regulator [Marinobacter psychrophilus]|jgi:transcriptional regulator GlxA family with amidase domain|uniref:choline metabolism transcriptional regulator GbdR n=1 Tax=Marinobacter psychrophilus TaxID=330734 RepID=UPI002356D390|nr:GlxA family transcriptional regulator [Marinobacter psychrophilus]
MMSTNERPGIDKLHASVPAQGQIQTLGFLLLDNFTLISMAAAIEPLRMANQLAGRTLYYWVTLSLDGAPVRASDGVLITPDAATSAAPPIDTVIVCGGVGVERSTSREHIVWLKAQARLSRRLGAVCTGSWALARAGLLDGYEASVHWEYMVVMKETFQRVTLTERLFCIDRDRPTASGGTAPLDMMLSLIARDHSKTLSSAISEMFIYDMVRNEQDLQRVPLKHWFGSTQPKLLEIVALMEANLEEPICLDELAAFVLMSRRQLERLFQKHLLCSPSRYYIKLRLTRARQLLKQSSLSIVEVASACGFVSTSHFSRCYREYFGIPPRSERISCVSGPFNARAGGAATALIDAQGEPTYGSVQT